MQGCILLMEIFFSNFNERHKVFYTNILLYVTLVSDRLSCLQTHARSFYKLASACLY